MYHGGADAQACFQHQPKEVAKLSIVLLVDLAGTITGDVAKTHHGELWSFITVFAQIELVSQQTPA